MGRSAKIRHRRRRRQQLHEARAARRHQWLMEMADRYVVQPLQQRRLYPLGVMPVKVESSRTSSELDHALSQALRDLDAPSGSGQEPRAESQEPPSR